MAAYYIGGDSFHVPWTTLAEICHPMFSNSFGTNLLFEKNNEAVDTPVNHLINPLDQTPTSSDTHDDMYSQAIKSKIGSF